MTARANTSKRLAVRLLIATRLGAGLVAFVAPKAVLSVLHKGIDETSDIPTRLLGARELGFGALLALAKDRTRRGLLGVGIAVDLADAYIGATAPRGEESRVTHRVIVAAGVAAALLGVVALLPAKSRPDA